MVDNEVHVIGALDSDDPRVFEIKIAERRDQQSHRLKPKDGLDVLRVLRVVDTASLAGSLMSIAAHQLSGAAAASDLLDEFDRLNAR